MSYCIIQNLETGKTEVLGDVEQAKKNEGLPHYRPGHGFISQRELDDNDKAGE